jgi:hypothetical protein
MNARASDTAEAPATPKRTEEQRAQRRRRADTTHEGTGRLSVREDLLDRKKFTYRWINDTAGRIEAMTKRDDWDIVTDPDIKVDGKNEGAQVRELVGKHPDGSPQYSYLCKKPLDWHREDRAKKMREVNQLEADLKRGVSKGAGALSADNASAYIPAGGISLESETGVRRKSASYEP